MKLRFEERPYAGKTFRPRPEIYLDEAAQLLIVATPWGTRAAAKTTIERMTDFLSTREDREATSPFERLSCLSTQANNLRISALLANEAIYREDNLQEYRSGVELFAAVVDDNEIVWIQSGNPQILLGRQNRSLLPLGSQVDLAFDLTPSGEKLFAPLPSQLLGLDTSLNLNINSFRAQPGDRVVLLSHSHLPEALFTMKEAQTDLDQLSRALARIYPDLAFWLGILTFADDANAETSDTSMERNQEQFG